MELGLKGKVAVVTGAGSQIGFGKAIVMGLAKEGCDIVACDVDLEGAKKTAAEVEAIGQKAIAPFSPTFIGFQKVGSSTLPAPTNSFLIIPPWNHS